MRETYWLCAILVIGGCGGGEAPAETAPTEVSVGGEAEAEEASVEGEPEAEPEPEPEPSGPAHVTYAFTAHGEALVGTVKVRAGTGEVLAEGAVGERLEVPSGDYRVECTADKAVLVDGPTVWDALSIGAGEDATPSVEFPWAKARFVVKVNGNEASGSVTLLRRGAEVATVPIAADEYVMISPGRYQARVKTRRSEIEVPEVVIPGEATRNVPINVTF